MSRSLRMLLVAATVAPDGAALAADEVIKAARRTPVAASDRCATLELPAGTPEVPGGDIFGFLSPSDIGDPCSLAFASETTGRAGKRDGSYVTTTTKSQFSYTYSDQLAFAASPFVSTFSWNAVTVTRGLLLTTGDGVDHASLRTFDFDGVSIEASWRVLARSAGQPFAITLSTEPRWFLRDAITGFRVNGHQVELKILADVALSESWFAALNVIYGFGSQKLEIPNAELEKGSAVGLLSAVTWQPYASVSGAVQGIFLGLEARYISGFSGHTLNFKVGEGLFTGPTLAIAFANGSMLNLAWSPQVWGRGHATDTVGPLDLDAFEKHQFRAKLATPF